MSFNWGYGMSEADKIMDDALYIDSIFSHIKEKWPHLHKHVIEYKANTTLATTTMYARSRLQDVIGYHEYNHFDGIIKHIQKNEHMIDWWIL